MAKSQGLTPDDRVKLKTLDTLLGSDVPRSHTIVAALIVQHWSDEHNAFQGQLIMRAERWRRRHIQLRRQWRRGEFGIFSDLMRILELPGDIESGVRAPQKRRTKRLIQPSLLSKAPSGMITDEEAAGFLKMLDADGISDIFDPGNHILDNTVFRPPLILLDGKSIFFDNVWPMYLNVTIERPWDPEDRTSEFAFAIDYVLVVIHKEKKWTWPIADRCLVRLPWGHPWKMTQEGRPVWEASLQILSKIGLIEKHHGQTWGLTQSSCVETATVLRTRWSEC